MPAEDQDGGTDTDSVQSGDGQGQQETVTRTTQTTVEAGPTAEDIARLRTALEKERAASRANAAAARELQALKASQLSETEKAVQAARAEAAAETAKAYAGRFVALSIKAAAGAKFRDPNDAVAGLRDQLDTFLDPSGDVDEKAVQAAVARLLKDKPYLGVDTAPPAFDNGQRNGSTAGRTDMDRLIRSSRGITPQ